MCYCNRRYMEHCKVNFEIFLIPNIVIKCAEPTLVLDIPEKLSLVGLHNFEKRVGKSFR